MSVWAQHEITLPSVSRGVHPITRQVVQALSEMPRVKCGLLNLFLLHTSASLTINENASPEVPRDLERALNHTVPEDLPFRHTLEGSDDMPAHAKSSLVGCSLNLPVKQGSLVLGTWQGIFLCEHRNHGGSRKIVLTLQGEPG